MGPHISFFMFYGLDPLIQQQIQFNPLPLRIRMEIYTLCAFGSVTSSYNFTRHNSDSGNSQQDQVLSVSFLNPHQDVSWWLGQYPSSKLPESQLSVHQASCLGCEHGREHGTVTLKCQQILGTHALPFVSTGEQPYVYRLWKGVAMCPAVLLLFGTWSRSLCNPRERSLSLGRETRVTTKLYGQMFQICSPVWACFAFVTYMVREVAWGLIYLFVCL